MKRGAEREGRRTRRRREREKAGIYQHNDGLSSDDEETELDMATYYKDKGKLKIHINFRFRN